MRRVWKSVFFLMTILIMVALLLPLSSPGQDTTALPLTAEKLNGN